MFGKRKDPKPIEPPKVTSADKCVPTEEVAARVRVLEEKVRDAEVADKRRATVERLKANGAVQLTFSVWARCVDPGPLTSCSLSSDSLSFIFGKALCLYDVDSRESVYVSPARFDGLRKLLDEIDAANAPKPGPKKPKK